MTTSLSPTSFTPGEVQRLSERSERLYELVGGGLIEKPRRGTLGGVVMTNVMYALSSVYRPEQAFVLVEQLVHCFADAGLMRRPGVSLVWSHRLPDGLTDDELGIAPDLAVDVVAPGQAYSDVTRRVVDYLAASVPLVWVVDPPHRWVQAYRPDGSVAWFRGNDILKDEPLLPGFNVRVADIFPATAPATP